jgi:hypothetical protein
MQMLSLISHQMMTNYQDLQDKLFQTDLKFTQELQRVTNENMILKQELQSAMQHTSGIPQSGGASSATLSVPAQTTSTLPSPVSSSSVSVPISTQVVSSSSHDGIALRNLF